MAHLNISTDTFTNNSIKELLKIDSETKHKLLYYSGAFDLKLRCPPLVVLALETSNEKTLSALLASDAFPIHLTARDSDFEFKTFALKILNAGTFFSYFSFLSNFLSLFSSFLSFLYSFLCLFSPIISLRNNSLNLLWYFLSLLFTCY